jgi:hypothetical protein
MNLYNRTIRNEDEEETPKELPENPMEKMMSGWQFDKKLLNSVRYFYGV